MASRSSRAGINLVEELRAGINLVAMLNAEWRAGINLVEELRGERTPKAPLPPIRVKSRQAPTTPATRLLAATSLVTSRATDSQSATV